MEEAVKVLIYVAGCLPGQYAPRHLILTRCMLAKPCFLSQVDR